MVFSGNLSRKQPDSVFSGLISSVIPHDTHMIRPALRPTSPFLVQRGQFPPNPTYEEVPCACHRPSQKNGTGMIKINNYQYSSWTYCGSKIIQHATTQTHIPRKSLHKCWWRKPCNATWDFHTFTYIISIPQWRVDRSCQAAKPVRVRF